MIRNRFKYKNFSIAVPYNEEKEILFQDRKSISKNGEEWWFFGGGVEKWETYEEALEREMEEELSIKLNSWEYHYIGSVTKNIAWLWDEISYIYWIPFNDSQQKNIEVKEWDGAEFFSFQELRELRMVSDSLMYVDLIEEYFWIQ